LQKLVFQLFMMFSCFQFHHKITTNFPENARFNKFNNLSSITKFRYLWQNNQYHEIVCNVDFRWHL